MDAVTLAQLFVEYAETKKRLDDLRAQIETHVLEIGESQKIAGVIAKYYKPSTKVDYEAACKSVCNDALIRAHSTETLKTRWKEICDLYGVDLSEFTIEIPAKVIVE